MYVWIYKIFIYLFILTAILKLLKLFWKLINIVVDKQISFENWILHSFDQFAFLNPHEICF